MIELFLSEKLFLLQGVLLILILCLWTPLRNYWRFRQSVLKLPGPPGLPLVGCAFEFFNKEHSDILPHIGALWKQYGTKGLFRFVVFSRAHVTVCQPEFVQIILSSNDEINKAIEYKHMSPWLGEGLLISSGSKWHRRRKQLTPAFHFRILEDFIGIINDHSAILVKCLKKEINGKSFDFFQYVNRATLDVISETAMGRRINAQEETNSTYTLAVKRIARIIEDRNMRPWYYSDWIFNMSPMGREQKKLLKILHGFTEMVIRDRKLERKKNPPKPDSYLQEDIQLGKKKRRAFLDLILDIAEKEGGFGDADIREEVDTFMFGGHDTTATGISWTLYLIGHHPKIQKQLREELDDVLGEDPSTQITSDHLTQLKYLERVIKESHRLFPPVPVIGRRIMQNIKIGEFEIPQGVGLMLDLYWLHRNPKHFPDPEKFDPDRFLPEQIQRRHPYAYIPFSAGPRNCIGQKFALMEEKIMLAYLLRAYQVESIVPLNEVKVAAAIILQSINGILLRIKPRQ